MEFAFEPGLENDLALEASTNRPQKYRMWEHAVHTQNEFHSLCRAGHRASNGLSAGLVRTFMTRVWTGKTWRGGREELLPKLQPSLTDDFLSAEKLRPGRL